jgi:hypothetical protein
MRKYNYIIASLLGIILFSCKPEIQDDFKPSNGSLDFSTYVSMVIRLQQDMQMGRFTIAPRPKAGLVSWLHS